MANSTNPVLTVTQLTSLVRTSLESEFLDFWLEGEVSNVRMPASGHMYFTLKDANSQIRAVAFRSIVRQIRFSLEDGLQIVVRGRMTVYEPRGDFQVVVESIEPKGVGALQIAFEQLKTRLAQEGLFDQTRKRGLPFLPQKIGIVTSLSGAAIRDILTVLHRRCPIMSVVIYPVPVQGEGAAVRIAQGIRQCNQMGEVEVLIVSRGGGSWEDLWCFNEEVVVRAIADSDIPVVSAVGHEIDVTLADFVADYRAATPSSAAEAVTPVLRDIKESIAMNVGRVIQGMEHQLQIFRHRFQTAQSACPHPAHIIQHHAQCIDDLDHRLTQAISRVYSVWRPRIDSLRVSLNAHSPRRSIRQGSLVIHQLLVRLQNVLPSLVTLKRRELQRVITLLQDLSPLATLARGYSMVELVASGDIVRSIGDVEVGTRIRARLFDGHLSCKVEKVQKDASHLDL
ncbi:MAG: exodeoxyribonuclease VII large subunit [Nitrospirota bacterium]|nr:exodeoxyribonuclease VII large subunit [Nitrospirota bacterium]